MVVCECVVGLSCVVAFGFGDIELWLLCGDFFHCLEPRIGFLALLCLAASSAIHVHFSGCMSVWCPVSKWPATNSINEWMFLLLLLLLEQQKRLKWQKNHSPSISSLPCCNLWLQVVDTFLCLVLIPLRLLQNFTSGSIRFTQILLVTRVYGDPRQFGFNFLFLIWKTKLGDGKISLVRELWQCHLQSGFGVEFGLQIKGRIFLRSISFH